MDAAPVSEPAKSVDTLVLFLLPKVIDDEGQWASFRDKGRYMEFGEQEARAFLEGLPEQYRGRELKVKLFPESHGGVLTYEGSPHRVGVEFHQGARLLPPGSESDRDCVFIPGFTVLLEERDRQGVSAILRYVIDRMYVQVNQDTNEWGVRRGNTEGIKDEGQRVIAPYLRGVTVQTMHADVTTGVYRKRVVL